jgi:hypothetical protein
VAILDDWKIRGGLSMNYDVEAFRYTGNKVKLIKRYNKPSLKEVELQLLKEYPRVRFEEIQISRSG